MLTLYGCKGCGNVIVEALCTLTGEPFVRRDVEPWTPGAAADELRTKNPLAQVPTLVLEDGTIMTESVAIALYLLERRPDAHLAPAPADAQRPTFLRWLVYFCAAIYPMYVVGDFPERFVEGDEATRKAFRGKTVERVLANWKIVEDALAPKAFLLGDEMSALDLFAAVMTRWRPGRDKLRAVAPGVIAAAERVEAHPKLAPLFAANF